MQWVYNDGGRKEAGYKGAARDCVTRAICIITKKSYQEVYEALVEEAMRERPRNGKKRSHSRTGVQKPTIRRYLESLGFEWVPTMKIGSGCKVHLNKDELPSGELIVSVSRHLVAVVDGIVYDTHDPTRGGNRCVYGYFRKTERK